MSGHKLVVVLDYGSQYTQLITRRVRELGIYSKILPYDVSLERLASLSPAALILSGGPSSVYDEKAPQLPTGFLKFAADRKIPILGICYGMQLVVKALGGEVERAPKREYGAMKVDLVRSQLFPASGSCMTWQSHGDETVRLPQGFSQVATSASGGIAAMESPGIYGLQFHPEVTHTEGGQEMLRNFLVTVAGIRPDWSMGSIVDEQVEAIRRKVGPTGHAICALSGGVDSAVAATLVHKALGDRLHCFFVDHGLLRFQEQQRVMKLFRENLNLSVVCLDHSEKYLSKLAGVTDPERKRKIIDAEFIGSFEEAAHTVAKQLGLRDGELPKFLVQGTLYPDVIESSAGHKTAAMIKSHHNVGGLPANMRFELIEPLRELFKDEVRMLGRELGVTDRFLKRHPFPGPGLAVRVIGDITREKLDILRQVDEIFIQSLLDDGLYDSIWQAFAVFLPIRTVGVQGDGRTHDHVVALRAVGSSDGMTADWVGLDHKFLAKVSTKICNEVRGVSRVVYDITSKPPATIEWE